MITPKYKKGAAVQVDSLERQVKAIDLLIESGRLVVDMLQGTAAMDSYLWLYYTQKDELMHGFCLMLRRWLNFQHSWKKGELLRMVEEGAYSHIQEDELKELANQKQYPIALTGRVSPTLLRSEKLSGNMSDGQKKEYLEEYIHARYCLWPDAAPILVVCVGNDGKVVASVEQVNQPSNIRYQAHD